MTKIEERAKEYVNASLYDNSVTRKQYSYRAYIKGAIEQKQIDIEKACEVYRKELLEIIEILNKTGKPLYNVDELGELISLDGCVKDFRTAMEE